MKYFIELAVVIFGLGALVLVFVAGSDPLVSDIGMGLSVSDELLLNEPIRIYFQKPVKSSVFEQALEIEPRTGITLQWEDDFKELEIKPLESWKEGTRYRLSVNKTKMGRFSEIGGDFEFSTVSYPKIVDIYPGPGSQDVLLGIEDPISISFDRTLEKFNVKIIVAPSQEFVSRLDEEKKKVMLLPSEKLEQGKEYEVKVHIRHKKEGEERYRPLETFSFSTLPPAPLTWDADFVQRVVQAKRFTEPRIKEGKYIDINLSSQIMTIFEDGAVLDAYLVSSGKRGMDTPVGTFQIYNKHPRPWSNKYSLYMPYWMAFTGSGSYGIHELPEWPGGYKEGVDHLGIPVSHGCVRLGVGPAARVYDWAEVGTPVVIHQ